MGDARRSSEDVSQSNVALSPVVVAAPPSRAVLTGCREQPLLPPERHRRLWHDYGSLSGQHDRRQQPDIGQHTALRAGGGTEGQLGRPGTKFAVRFPIGTCDKGSRLIMRSPFRIARGIPSALPAEYFGYQQIGITLLCDADRSPACLPTLDEQLAGVPTVAILLDGRGKPLGAKEPVDAQPKAHCF